MLQVTLASQSPQRIALLACLGLEVLVQPSGVDEATIAVPASPAEQVRTLARAKAEAVARRQPRRVVLGADTLVAMDGQALGKPGTPEAAAAMLRRLSGRRHAVHTGIALVVPAERAADEPSADGTGADAYRQVRRLLPNLRINTEPTSRTLSAVVSASVTFRPLDEDQIAAYVRSGEPLDKAGGYGIQGAGSSLVTVLRGCFTTVVGLPVCAVRQLLRAVSNEDIRCAPDPGCRIGGRRRCLCGDDPPLAGR